LKSPSIKVESTVEVKSLLIQTQNGLLGAQPAQTKAAMRRDYVIATNGGNARAWATLHGQDLGREQGCRPWGIVGMGRGRIGGKATMCSWGFGVSAAGASPIRERLGGTPSRRQRVWDWLGLREGLVGLELKKRRREGSIALIPRGYWSIVGRTQTLRPIQSNQKSLRMARTRGALPPAAECDPPRKGRGVRVALETPEERVREKHLKAQARRRRSIQDGQDCTTS
jgi:hypothetical protein